MAWHKHVTNFSESDWIFYDAVAGCEDTHKTAPFQFPAQNVVGGTRALR